MYFGLLFHVIWNAVPVKLEQHPNSTGTAFQITWNNSTT